ncbi:hypothetical protein ACTXT7_003527 [Hymenolepis weldensis]
MPVHELTYLRRKERQYAQYCTISVTYWRLSEKECDNQLSHSSKIVFGNVTKNASALQFQHTVRYKSFEASEEANQVTGDIVKAERELEFDFVIDIDADWSMLNPTDDTKMPTNTALLRVSVVILYQTQSRPRISALLLF